MRHTAPRAESKGQHVDLKLFASKTKNPTREIKKTETQPGRGMQSDATHATYAREKRRHARKGVAKSAALTFEAPAHRRALLQLCILQNLVELGRKGLGRTAPSLGRLRSGRLVCRRRRRCSGCSRCRACAGSRSSPVLGHEREPQTRQPIVSQRA